MPKQISDLTLLATPDSPDLIILRDVSASVDKKTTVGGLAAAVATKPPSSLTNAMFSGAAGEVGGAWQTYTPTLGGFTLGNGTMVAKYWRIGKTYLVKVSVTSGSTSATTNPIVISSPVASTSYISSEPVGVGRYRSFHGPVVWNDANSVTLRWYSVTGSGIAESVITSSSPDVLGGAGQTWFATWWFEAA